MAASHSRRTRGEGSGRPHRRRDLAGVYLILTNPISGAKLRRAVRGRTRAAAVAKLCDTLRTSAAAGAFPSGELTAAYLHSWLEKVRPQVRPGTFREYSRSINRYVIPALGDVELSRLLPSQVEHLTTAIVGRGPVRHDRPPRPHRFRHALADAMRDGLLTCNVAALARPPRVERTEMQTLDPEQVRGLLDVTIADPLGPLFTLAVTTGLRQGELLGLRWADVTATTLTVRRRWRGQETARGGSPSQRHRAAAARSTCPVEPSPRSRSSASIRRRFIGGCRKALGRIVSAWSSQTLWAVTSRRPLCRTASASRADTLGFTGVRFHDLRHSTASIALPQGAGSRP